MPAEMSRSVEMLVLMVMAQKPGVIHAHNWIVSSALPLRLGSPARLVLTLHDYSHVCAVKRLMRGGVPCAGPGPVRCPVCAARRCGSGSLFTWAPG